MLLFNPVRTCGHASVYGWDLCMSCMKTDQQESKAASLLPPVNKAQISFGATTKEK